MNDKEQLQAMFKLAALNFNKAVEINDVQLYRAVLINMLSILPSYLDAKETRTRAAEPDIRTGRICKRIGCINEVIGKRPTKVFCSDYCSEKHRRPNNKKVTA